MATEVTLTRVRPECVHAGQGVSHDQDFGRFECVPRSNEVRPVNMQVTALLGSTNLSASQCVPLRPGRTGQAYSSECVPSPPPYGGTHSRDAVVDTEHKINAFKITRDALDARARPTR